MRIQSSLDLERSPGSGVLRAAFCRHPPGRDGPDTAVRGMVCLESGSSRRFERSAAVDVSLSPVHFLLGH